MSGHWLFRWKKMLRNRKSTLSHQTYEDDVWQPLRVKMTPNHNNEQRQPITNAKWWFESWWNILCCEQIEQHRWIMDGNYRRHYQRRQYFQSNTTATHTLNFNCVAIDFAFLLYCFVVIRFSGRGLNCYRKTRATFFSPEMSEFDRNEVADLKKRGKILVLLIQCFDQWLKSSNCAIKRELPALFRSIEQKKTLFSNKATVLRIHLLRFQSTVSLCVPCVLVSFAIIFSLLLSMLQNWISSGFSHFIF